MGGMPKGWLDYTPLGKRLEGTRFICFKVPLQNADLRQVPEDNRMDPQLLLDSVPELGLIIDLTDTTRYYDPSVFTKRGLEYRKIAVAGHVLPPPDKHKQFSKVVNDFLDRNADNDKLIGVHCTHGCNRTGLMLCTHLVNTGQFSATDAIEAFQSSRGHAIHRDNYIDSIQRSQTAFARRNGRPPSIDTQSASSQSPLQSSSSQSDTNADPTGGSQLPAAASPFDVRLPPPVLPLPLQWYVNSQTQRKQATLVVEPHHLVADGQGGYFVRVAVKENAQQQQQRHQQRPANKRQDSVVADGAAVFNSRIPPPMPKFWSQAQRAANNDQQQQQQQRSPTKRPSRFCAPQRSNAVSNGAGEINTYGAYKRSRLQAGAADSSK